jgi:hypothetical protein
MGTGLFKGVKRPELGVDHSSPSNAEVKERVELFWAFMVSSRVNFTYTFNRYY